MRNPEHWPYPSLEALSEFSDKEVAMLAQKRLSDARKRSEVVDELLEGAISNLDFIDRLRRLPEINTYLTRTDKNIGILWMWDTHKDSVICGLEVDKDGVKTIDKRELRILISGDYLKEEWNRSKETERWIRVLGNLTKKQIIDRFEKGVKGAPGNS